MATDILMLQTPEGGDFVLENNDFLLSQSLENQVPLYLFGGNIEQDTEIGDSANEINEDWWANSIIDDEPFNSTFERTLRDVVLNSSGLSKLVNAAKEDLKPLGEYANISVTGNIKASNQFELIVNIKQPGKPNKKSLYLFEGTELIRTELYVN